MFINPDECNQYEHKKTFGNRSWLLISPDDGGIWPDVSNSVADAIVCDLTHRPLCGLAPLPRGINLYIQIGGDSCPITFENIKQAVMTGAAGVVLADVRDGAGVQYLDVLLSVAEVEAGTEPGKTQVIAMIGDNPHGSLNAGTLRGRSSRLSALGWDAAALAARLGIFDPVDPYGLPAPLQTARAMTVLAAAQNNMQAIDTITSERDDNAFLKLCHAAKSNGFFGKFVLTEKQASIVNSVFTSVSQGLEG